MPERGDSGGPDGPPKRNGNGNGITIAAIGAIVGLVISAVGFFATYVFTTKTEMSAHVREASDGRHAIEKNQALTEAAVKQLTEDVGSVKVEMRLTNRNINKLLRRQRIEPVSRDAVRIEMEEEEEEP